MQQNIDSFAYFHSTINSKWKVLRFLLFSSSFSISLSHSSNDQNCSVVLKSIRHNRLFCLIQLKQIQMKSVTKSAVYSKQKPKKKTQEKRWECLYRPFKHLDRVRCCLLTTIVGSNFTKWADGFSIKIDVSLCIKYTYTVQSIVKHFAGIQFFQCVFFLKSKCGLLLSLI